MKPKQLLRRMFDAAIASSQPALCVPRFLPDLAEVRGRVVVIGAGKASAAMAEAVEQHWQGRGIERVSGLVVTRYGYGAPCRHIEIAEAAHPVPDAAGEAAARRMLGLVHGLAADDLVLCLVSGGGSALLPLPAAGLTLADKQGINRALLASGATISEMNTVRRHLSAIKGGRLAAACHPARVLTLLVSDVPGDRPIDIASGPTVADPSTCADALAIVRRYAIGLPAAARELLQSARGESVKPGDARLARAEAHIVAAPQLALEAAADVARAAGYAAHILGDSIEGEARDVGKVLAAIALQVARHRQPFAPPCVLLSGGETTVTLRGAGRGGRNVECLLAAAIALDGQPRIHGLAGDTDGVDGVEEIAGAAIGPDTLARAWAAGLRPRDELDANNGHGFFQRLGDSVVTGPTRTNVNDFRALLIECVDADGSDGSDGADGSDKADEADGADGADGTHGVHRTHGAHGAGAADDADAADAA
ncbi:MAG: glycerate kinase [Proteobacteria bacterium]|nr:glycerate kinase [Pseudomonadota bacterium]